MARKQHGASPEGRLERPQQRRYALTSFISAMHLLMNGMTHWLGRAAARRVGISVACLPRAEEALDDA
jgi:hypothetical protein